MSTFAAADRDMLSIYGYIDYRDQSKLVPEDRLSPLAGGSRADDGCPGCASTTCACGPRSTASSRRPETLQQARTWERVKNTYLSDGFCEPCSVQAAYGHQMGFSQVSPVCSGCAGMRPTWRRAGDEALRWARTPLHAVVRLGDAA